MSMVKLSQGSLKRIWISREDPRPGQPGWIVERIANEGSGMNKDTYTYRAYQVWINGNSHGRGSYESPLSLGGPHFALETYSEVELLVTPPAG